MTSAGCVYPPRRIQGVLEEYLTLPVARSTSKESNASNSIAPSTASCTSRTSGAVAGSAFESLDRSSTLSSRGPQERHKRVPTVMRFTRRAGARHESDDLHRAIQHWAS